jgi:primosomal protein N' (replication factor Y)
VDNEGTGVSGPEVLRVAINAPLRRLFDYLPPKGLATVAKGMRLRVPFGRTRQVGVVVGIGDASELPRERLKRALEVIDERPLLSDTDLDLLLWAARYYAHPVGEVVAAALPSLVRKGRDVSGASVTLRVTDAGREADVEALARRAPRQAGILRRLLDASVAGPDAADAFGPGWRDAFRRLSDRGLCEEATQERRTDVPVRIGYREGPPLTDRQRAAVDTIAASASDERPLLLFGVTGSGKTEVYLEAIEKILRDGGQAMVLVPEIGLTPQLVRRFRRRFDCPMAVLHSGLTDRERLDAWLAARDGAAPVVIGTRSAVFTPLPRCGLIVVDEEHDSSFKQQEGFRYSARDLAVVRGRLSGAPVVLGSATPSLESWRNAAAGRYRRMDLPERPGASSHPRMRTIDLRTTPARDGLTAPLLAAMQRHLDAGDQVMLYLNRRGYATAMFCCECGWVAECSRCDARMVLHQRASRLRCHHCGSESAPPSICAECGSGLRPIGQGTEKIEDELARCFPGLRVARLDRDSTASSQKLARVLEDMRTGDTRILVGTQMLTKGHDFPDVTLVGVLDADQGLFGTDFRSDERLAQTILQVSGRAGRRHRQGEVLLQTAYPQHPLLGKLIGGGYGEFADEALREREAARWPPYSHLALVRAQAHRREIPLRFLAQCARAAEADAQAGVRVLGPGPAPMEKRSGRYRAHLLLQADQRAPLHALIDRLLLRIESMPDTRRVRWSLDVDPVELY